MNEYNILLVGVGGQGIILASDLLANLGLTLGLDVKKSEVHGMAQRGGSVESHVRLGSEVLSPVIPRGQADFVLSTEEVESLRNMDYPRSDAVVLASTFRVIPPSVTVGDANYPSSADILTELQRHFPRSALVDVPAIMQKIGNTKTANVILLGALSCFLPFPLEAWMATMAGTLPAKILGINEIAFAEGIVVGQALKEGFNRIVA